MIKRTLRVNGIPRAVIAEADQSLANVLREQLGLTGTKIGCGQAQCGCCSVILDDKLVRSCVTKMSKVADGASVITVEGIGNPDNLHPIQLSWIVNGGAQCGFCTPVSSCRSRPCSTRTPAPPGKMCASGSRPIATPAAARATDNWWMP